MSGIQYQGFDPKFQQIPHVLPFYGRHFLFFVRLWHGLCDGVRSHELRVSV